MNATTTNAFFHYMLIPTTRILPFHAYTTTTYILPLHTYSGLVA